MKQVDSITTVELADMAKQMYGDLVKAVIDIEKNLLVVDAEMHADEEEFLLKNGSKQEDLWGINFYPAKFGTGEFIEFDSMINIRPRQHNRSRNVEDKDIQKRIKELVAKIVSQ
jgi:hypothetical protein